MDMQTKVARILSKFAAIVAVLSLSTSALALDPGETVRATVLMKTTTSWDGAPIVWPQGKAEVTALRVEIAPGGETGWHRHKVPSFAVMLEGTLDIRLADGRVKRLQPGDVLAEVVHPWHNGRNAGGVPVRLVVFYAGVEGRENTMKAP